MAGRHFSYTQDRKWVLPRAGNLKKAANYIISQRQLKAPQLPGYGLVAGTCADPIEAKSAFMLNAYNAAGLESVATLLKAVGDPETDIYRAFADDYRQVLLKAFEKAFAIGRLIPTAPGRWVPSCASDAEGRGLQFMALNGEHTFSHRSYTAFDALIGPIWAIYLGVIPKSGQWADWLLEINHRHMNRHAIAETQPYYSRHPELHLLRGEHDLFLNAFYSGFTSLADRETFAFWEHQHKVSIHKTHEEAWALMQLRRMLWVESDDALLLLAGIPEQWLDVGQKVQVTNGWSYFGRFTLSVERLQEGGQIRLQWEPDFHTPPGKVLFHLPGLEVLPGKGIRIQRL